MEDFIIDNNELVSVNITGSVIIPHGVTSIKKDAFKNKTIGSLYIPSTVEHIAPSSFTANSIKVAEDNPFFYSIDNAIYSKENHELIHFSNNKNNPIIIKKDSSIYYYYPSSGLIKNIVIGKEVRSINFVEMNGFQNLEQLNIDKENPFFSSKDGIVYNKDKSTLLYIPYNYPRVVKILKTVKEVSNKYSIYHNLKGFSVEDGNDTFIENEGVLYRKDGDFYYWDTVSNNKSGTLFIPGNFTADIHPSIGFGEDPILNDLWIDLKRKENRKIQRDLMLQLMKEDEESFVDDIHYIEENDITPQTETKKIIKSPTDISDPLFFDYDFTPTTIENPVMNGMYVDSDFCNYSQITESILQRLQNLEYIQVSKDNEKYASYDGILYSRDMSVLLFCPVGRKGKIVIKEGCKKINNAAFRNCKYITSVVIPQSVNASGICAFENCINLKEVSLSRNMTKISGCMFYNCINLSSINIPEGVKMISKDVFSGCDNMSYLQLPSSLKAIDLDCFAYNSRTVTVLAPKVDNINMVASMKPLNLRLLGTFGKPMRDFAQKHRIPILSYENNRISN